MTKQNYNTKAKKYILEYLSLKNDKAVNAGDILQFLKSKGENINITTVYRCLNRLSEQKKIIKFTETDSNRAVYQLSNIDNECENHLHIQCKNCGKILHLDCGFLNDFQHHIMEHHGFLLEYSGSILYGICNDCRKKL